MAHERYSAWVDKLPGPHPTEVVYLCDTEAAVLVGIVPSKGGEIASLKIGPSSASSAAAVSVATSPESLLKEGRELIYKALVYDDAALSEGWRGKAQVLFPAVGRHTDDVLSSSSGAECTVSIDSSAFPHEFLTAHYPFQFSLSITYKVKAGQVMATHTITNKGCLKGVGLDASTPMPFAIGNHISFAFPFGDGVPFGCTTLQSRTVTHDHHLTPGSLLSGEATSLNFLDGVPLHYPAATNGVFGMIEGSNHALDMAWRERDGSPHGISITQSILNRPSSWTDEQDDAVSTRRFFVLWGAEAEKFLCIEPWLGGPDALNSWGATPTLLPEESMLWRFTVTPQL